MTAREIVLRGRGPNTASVESMRALSAELAEANGDPILLYGAGEAFSAGLDVSALPADPFELLDAMEQLVERLYLYRGPVVACIHGHAIAGGYLIATCCDHRVLTTDPDARVGMTGVALGLSYPPNVLAVLRDRLPAHARERVLLGGDRFAPTEALALGLVDELADDPFAVARARLASLATHPPEAYAELKHSLRAPALAAVTDADRERFRLGARKAWDRDAVLARFRRPR